MTATQTSGAGGEGEAPPAPVRVRVALPDAVRPWLDYLRSIREQIRLLEEAKVEAVAMVRTHLAGAEEGLMDGAPVVRDTVVHTRRLDTTKLKVSEPEVYDRYARTTTSTRFTLVDE